ncbi:MAG: DNA-processing protein DprA [Bacteroidales bacterium]|nr:DNA-processing protein DprA [Bacteroidales bacterium]MBR4214132.1 DNA-processing protein DprA [Bacteroidales bacterium]
MELNQDAVYAVAVTLIPGVGSSTARKLVNWAGNACQVFEKRDLLRASGKFSQRIIDALGSQSIIDQAKRQIDIAIKNNISITYFTDNNYPRKLAQCDDAPILYYTKGGGVNFDVCRTIGIVGSRLTDYEGRDNIYALVEGLKADGIRAVIVSGLAAGADTYAHQAAIQLGVPTAAVLGHGFDMIYPAENREMSEQIIHGAGMLITEYYYGHPVSKTNFPRRNRIVAGLCDALIIVQSRKKGGALITADYSMQYRREVFAFPGRATDKNYSGCNQLICDGKATLLTGYADLEQLMGWNSPKLAEPLQTEMEFPSLDPQEILIVDALRRNGEISIDVIAAESKIPMSELSPILLTLEFKDVIKSLPGKRYRVL